MREQVGVPGCTQRIADVGGAAVLPYDRASDGLSRGAFPQHSCLALIGDSDRSQLATGDRRLGQRFAHDSRLRRPDFVRVMLDPARLREMLREFLLSKPADTARAI